MNGGLWKQDSWTGLTLPNYYPGCTFISRVLQTSPASQSICAMFFLRNYCSLPEKLYVHCMFLKAACNSRSLQSISHSEKKHGHLKPTYICLINRAFVCCFFLVFVFVFSFGACCIRHIVFLLAISTDEFRRKQKIICTFLILRFVRTTWC